MPFGYDPNLVATMMAAGGSNPNLDTTLTVKSPLGNPAPGAAVVAGGAANPAQPKTPANGVNTLDPNLLGLIALGADLGGQLLGGQNSIGGNVSNVTSSFAKNALFSQLLQKAIAGGGGGQTTPPFNKAL